MTMKYTMVIADDEPVVLKSTELFLKKEFPDIEIVGMAENGIKLKEMLEAYNRIWQLWISACRDFRELRSLNCYSTKNVPLILLSVQHTVILIT